MPIFIRSTFLWVYVVAPIQVEVSVIVLRTVCLAVLANSQDPKAVPLYPATVPLHPVIIGFHPA